MSFYDSETCNNDNQNSHSESSRSSRESSLQNVNLDNERSTTTSLPNNLFWRSRSQPPFGETSNHVNTPGFSNTESSQQVSLLNHTDSVHTVGSSHQTVGAGLSGSTRSVGLGSTNRTTMAGTPRSSHHRRMLRLARCTQNRDSIPGLLSSSSSNSSLLGRYRTISGVNSRPQSIDPSICESHLSRLLRFCSLRFDDSVSNEAETSVRRQESPSGDCSNDEFAELPVRSGSNHYSLISAIRSSSEQNPLSHSFSTSNSTSQSQEQPLLNPGNSRTNNTSPISFSLISTNSDNYNNNEQVGNSSACVTDASETDHTSVCIPSTSKQCTVKFPKRGDLDHPRDVDGASSSYQPEADHDFYQNSCFSSKSHGSSDHVYRTFAKLNELRCHGLFCDVILQAGSVKVPAHRNVLAASSQYFHAMFTGSMAEARSRCVEFRGIEGSALIQLVNFIYTNEINVNEENVQTLLPAANLLQLTAVRDICCEFLQFQLHPSNCLGIQRFADLHNCQDLLDFTRRFTEQHFGELLKQDDELLKLNADQLIELISSDRLAVSEDQVFEAVLRWIAHNPSKRQTEARNLCSHVRFALLPRDYLVCLSQSDNFLTLNPWCKDYLIEALSYHLLPWDQKLRIASERTKPRTPVGLPKILLVIGGQAPKAIRSVECFEFQGGSWTSLSGDFGQRDNSSSSSQLLSNPTTSCQSTSNDYTNSVIPNVNCNSDNICNLIVSDLPSRRCRTGVAVLGGLMYVVGGFNGALRVRSVEVYDLLRNTWHSGPNMECRRATLGVAVLNGLIYAVGGFDGTVGLNSAEVLDIWSGSWRPIPSMTYQRSSVGVGAVDGKLYAVGGYDGTVRRCLSSVECYDPVSDSWSLVSDMTCRRSGPSVCELNNRLYAVGGHDGPTVQTSAEVFSPETGTWQRIADLNVKRRNAGLVAHDGSLYIIGGEDGENNLTSIEKYDPASNTWSILQSHLTIGRSYAGVAIVERNII
ncbi:unnamed protein product [Schistosoma turkestanicum]|nr:unnamed protein product [Schistosoma turkestanicum]